MIDLLILAVVQGIAEFLPISSSGHLVIIGDWLGELNETPTLEIVLHAGTLGSILVVFWRKIIRLLTKDRRVITLLVVGTIPAATVGICIKRFLPEMLRSPTLAGGMLMVTGVMLIGLGLLRERDGSYQRVSLAAAFLVGCFQAFAILPGISRSGSTILGGRLMGLKPEDSVTFSFLLAIPAIAGATILTLFDLWRSVQEGIPIGHGPVELIIGASLSFAVGVFALRWLLDWSREDRLHWFAIWCLPAGAIALFLCG